MCEFSNCFKIRREFQRFDENKDGLINQEEFGQFLRGIGLIPSDDEVKVGTGESKFRSDVDQNFKSFTSFFRRYMNRLTRTMTARLSLKNL